MLREVGWFLLSLLPAAPKPQVWFFLQEECPISKYYAPEIGRICREYVGAQCTAVLVNPLLSNEEARRKVRAMGLELEVRVDRDLAWVKRSGATVTPEVAVLDGTGNVFYRGRINDYFFGWGKRRGQVSAHDLREALDALFHQETYPAPWPSAVGCFIENGGVK